MFRKDLTSKEMEIRNFMIMLCMTCFATFLACYQNVVRSYNSTMLALSYEYGFTSRSLLGTIYHVINKILPVNMIDYNMALLFAQIVTGVFFLFLIYFCYLCVKKCKEEYLKPCEYIIMFFMLFTVATFSAGYNFFRVDLFMIWVSLIAAILIVKEKAEWLVVPLSAIGVMFHQGYVFMYFNIILILLIYKFFDAKDNKIRWKYGTLFILSFLLGSVLFLWFEFFSRSNGASIYEFIKEEARSLSLNGAYHTTLLQHEVLGIDLSHTEKGFRVINYVQFPLFTILLTPYIVVGYDFFKALIVNAKDLWGKFKYIFVAIGSLTMLPDFLLKIDYGRWILTLIIYYAVIVLALVMMGDKNVENQLFSTYERLKHKPWIMVLVVYPIFFIPLCDVDISTFLQFFADQMDEWFLHVY